MILRIIQGRNIRHRMVGRTVVIGDIPWVAQAAEAFLGTIFACSYSIAGCGVLSGNPADHLVHRREFKFSFALYNGKICLSVSLIFILILDYLQTDTHRVVRGYVLFSFTTFAMFVYLISLDTSQLDLYWSVVCPMVDLLLLRLRKRRHALL